MSKECDISLISLDDKCIDKMLSAYSLCEKYTIPAGTYQGQDTAVTTIGIKAVLIARQSLSDDVIKNVTKTLYEHADDFKYATSLDIPFRRGRLLYREWHQSFDRIIKSVYQVNVIKNGEV